MGNFKSYLIGFITSVVLTLAAYFATVYQAPATLWIITGLAIIQLIVQLIFFLHLGSTSPSSLTVLVSTISIILILVVGSIWIMNHLNYNMTPDQMNDYMMKSEGIMK